MNSYNSEIVVDWAILFLLTLLTKKSVKLSFYMQCLKKRKTETIVPPYSLLCAHIKINYIIYKISTYLSIVFVTSFIYISMFIKKQIHIWNAHNIYVNLNCTTIIYIFIATGSWYANGVYNPLYQRTSKRVTEALGSCNQRTSIALMILPYLEMHQNCNQRWINSCCWPIFRRLLECNRFFSINNLCHLHVTNIITFNNNIMWLYTFL